MAQGRFVCHRCGTDVPRKSEHVMLMEDEVLVISQAEILKLVNRRDDTG